MNTRIAIGLTTISALLLGTAACTNDTSDGRNAESAPGAEATTLGAPEAAPPRAPVHIDSIFPIEESLRRFRETSGPAPATLHGGAPALDALVERFLDALASSDTAAFVDMLLTREEFGWLYYPHTRFTERPYELAPELLWFQMQNSTSRGLGRLLDRLGGTRLVVTEQSCPPVPLREGPNRLWEGCALRIVPPGGEPASIRLFGTILERDGVFKFVSYSNDF